MNMRNPQEIILRYATQDGKANILVCKSQQDAHVTEFI